MPKQINVELGFKADTSQAKKQIQDLQNQLSKLGTNLDTNIGTQISKGIQDATIAVAKLKTQLQEATNVETGALDLSKFQQSLKQSGMSLSDYKIQLERLGPEGSAAFNQLANAIVSAEMPLRRSSALLDQFWTALKNTARWQISSSALHGLVGAMQGAYGYAQDLNASLNSIRIVSSQSTEQMAAFAEQANRAAQSLSTSTLAYTDAALIFYQQGLEGDEVTQRVDTVLKLSNVTGDSAEQVSDYMTAIWNNFYDGSESLESFADKITALGAATASSSAEISAGLQQFAAIGQTVGLSYDYAATALATIVARTRQSESTVGNGLRTVFARLSSLKEGDMTEDGVDLTKYTKALDEIGVKLFDQNGQYREMDGILDDIGEKWQTLSKNQQIALAQTVGGVRQYATIMALFDDWDQFQQNLDVTRNAEGTLQEQADIYAESWEAAKKRVKAAWQEIYQDLIDDKFFISLLDGLKSVLNGVDNLIDTLGGLPGVLSTILALILQLKGQEIGQSLSNLAYNLMPASVKDYDEQQIKKQALELQKAAIPEQDGTIISKTEIQNLETQTRINEAILNNKKNLTKEEEAILKNLLNQNKALQEQAVLSAKGVSDAQKEQEALEFSMGRTARKSGNFNNIFGNQTGAQYYNTIMTEYESLLTQVIKKTGDFEQANASLSEVETTLMEVFGLTEEQLEKYEQILRKRIATQEDLNRANNGLKNSEESINALLKQSQIAANNLGQSLVNVAQNISSLFMSINMLKGVWETIQNPDLSLWDKMVAIIPTVASALMILSKVRIADTLQTAKDSIITLANITLKIKHTKAIKDNTVSLARNTLAKRVNSGAAAQSAIAEGAETAATTGLGVASEGAAIGVTSLGKALLVLLKAAAPWLIGIGIVAGAIVALDKAIHTEKESLADSNKALEKSNEELERAEKTANKAREAYESLANAFKNLNNGQDVLKGLKKGTDEWHDAIEKANKELLTTLEQSGQMGKASFSYDTNGLLQVDNKEVLLNAAREESYFADMREYTSKLNNAQTSFDNFVKKLAVSLGQITYKERVRADRSDGTSVMRDQEAAYTGLDQKVEVLTNTAQRLIDKGYGEYSSEELIAALESGTDSTLNSILGKYQDLEGNYNEKVISAIVETGDKIVANNVVSDAYKTEMGRRYAEQNGLNIPEYAQQSAWNNIGNTLTKNLEEIGINELYDSKYLRKNILGQNQASEDAKRIYAAQTEGVEYDELTGHLLNESGENITKKIDAAYIARVAYLNDLIAKTDATDGKEEISKAVAEARQSIIEKIRENFKDFNAYGWGDKDYEAANEVLSSEYMNKIHNEEEFKSAVDERKYENGAHDHNADLTAEQLTQTKDTKAGIAALDEEIQELTQHYMDHAHEIAGVSENLKYCRERAQDFAESIIRFDDAIQDVTENYDDWMAALEKGEDAPERLEIAMEGLRVSYANLLDIDGSQLSDTFLKSKENLDDMKLAIQGNEEAYNSLVDTAATDYITAHLKIDPDEAVQAVNECRSILDANGFNDLEVNAHINSGPIYDELTRMINALASTTEEAEYLLSLWGVDATVVKDESHVRSRKEMVGAKVESTPGATMQAQVNATGFFSALTGDSSLSYSVPGFRMVEDRSEATEDSTVTVPALKIQNARKSAGGHIKHQQSTHGGGGVSPSKGKSSGGGGGSQKKKTVKEHTKHEKGEDRYHNIKSAINEVSKSLERLNKLQDRAYGKARLKYMDQTIDKLKDQVRLTDMYIDEAKRYLSLDRGRLEGLGMGAEFTEDGRLLNYEQVYQNIIGSYNGAIDAYNGAVDQFNASAQEDADNQMLDNAKKQLDNAKEVYDDNKQILKQYEDTYNTLQEQIDERVDLLNQIYDAKLEKVVWKVDIQLEVNDADLEVLDWINKYIQKDSKKAADSIANLSKQMGLFGKNITAVNGGLDELFENHGIQNYEDLTAEQLVDRLRSWQNAEELGSEITQEEADQIRNWMTALMGYADDMLEAFEEAHEQVDKALDSWNDKLDEQIQKFDDLRDFLDSYNDIINLTGQRMLGMSDQDLADIDRSIVSNSQNRLESLRRIMEENQTNLNRMRAVDTSGYTEDALREWEENIKHAEEVATESTKNYWDGFKQSLEDGETAYNNAMDRMAAQYKRTLGNLDFLSERFSRQQEVDHLYLDDYEKYNAINKDMAELSKNLEKTNNLALKSKIKDFQDELNDAMSTGVRISQRQADIYEKRVALLQAEAELLNAQNAKSAVRMTRDNEGNFSYTYTADQDAIDAAEENYSTSFYDYLKYMRDNQEELQNEQIQKMSQYMDDLTALYQAFYDGEITDLDAALAELNAQYDEYREYFIDQETMLFDEMGRLRDEDWEFAQEITGLKLAEEDDFITDFSDTLVGRLEPTYQTAEGWAMEWAEAIADSNTSARESLNLWYQDVNTTYKAAGTTVDNFRDLVKADLTAINQASNDTKTATDQMAIAMDNDMNNVIKKAVDMDRYWSTVMNDFRNQIEATVLKMDSMLRQLANIDDYEHVAALGAETARGAFAGMGDAAGSAVSPLNSMADALNNAAGAARNLRDALNGGDVPDVTTKKVQYYDYRGIPVDDSYTGQKYIGTNRGLQPVSGDTGMYTGAWGPEGKVAILHEKELVLNKEDTANILSVVDTVRGLANNFDISNGLNQFAKSILGSSQLAMAGTGSLDQNVHIEANFPNVESHNEIEMALNNLINSASQYVNRK